MKLDLSPEILKEEKTIIEDLIKAAHNNAKSQIKQNLRGNFQAAGGFGIPGFKWPLYLMQNISEIDELVKLISNFLV